MHTWMHTYASGTQELRNHAPILMSCHFLLCPLEEARKSLPLFAEILCILCSISSASSPEITWLLFVRYEEVDDAEHSAQIVRARSTILTAFNVADPTVVSTTSVNFACVLCMHVHGRARIYACTPSLAVLECFSPGLCLGFAPHAICHPHSREGLLYQFMSGLGLPLWHFVCTYCTDLPAGRVAEMLLLWSAGPL